MPRLYFDFNDGRSRFVDEEGIDLPDVKAGRAEVLRTLAEIAKDALPKSDQQAFTASIRNSSGEMVYSAKVTVSGAWHGSHQV
ncbi:hypothetical protein [Methylobacterium sp. Leaf117]|uniref:DUF6894 family protein n=1 Tax=Methylobacterium sp. Leaf117 TaxID=1736260 RepID=UPI0006FF4395|nr:hypothetical protein [Methylobacterium sp. Leaf117]KQP80647.1 hypothetical protein ASF57_17440 [Methylobacterium sp. Leaf117]